MRKLLLFLAAVSAFGQMRQNVFEAIPSPSGATVGEYRFRELPANGVEYSGFKGAAAVASNVLFTIPGAFPASDGLCMKSTTAGVLALGPCGGTELDVRDYGAVCDGVTNDTQAIQSTLNAISGTLGVAVLPRGTCIATGLEIVNSYIGIRGQGKYASILKSNTDGPVIRIRPFSVAVSSATNANPVAITTAAHGLTVGSVISIALSGATGSWTPINGTFAATITSSTAFTVPVNSTGFGALAGSVTAGHGAKYYYLDFHDFTIKGDAASTGQFGIEISGAYGWGESTIRNMLFEGLQKSIYDHDTFASGSGAITIADNVFYLTTVNGIAIERDTLEGSSWSISGNRQESPFTEIVGATSGNKFLYMHNFIGDLTANNNHIQSGWIAFDFSCDNGTLQTGTCGYGNSLVVTGNKIDGYANDFRLYNVSYSDFTGNRGRGMDRTIITGTSVENKYTPLPAGAETATGIEMSGTVGKLALNTYDAGRIRIGDVTQNLSNTANGISILDAGAGAAIAIGQTNINNVGLIWNHDATAGNAHGLLFTSGYNNPLLYGASYHEFINGYVGIGVFPSYGLDVGFQTARVGTTGTEHYIQLGRNATAASNMLIGAETGELAVYQGVLGGVATEYMRVTSTGGLNVLGQMSAANVNMTGSAYRVAGTSVITSARNASFVDLATSGVATIGDLRSTTASTHSIGQTGNRFLRAFVDGVTTGGSTFFENGSTLILRATNTFTIDACTTIGHVLTAGASGVMTCQAAASASLPVSDGTSVVEGSADATKELRFEVDGFTTATTRVLTPQNADYTIAGTNIAQTFSASQTFSGSTLTLSSTISSDILPTSTTTYVLGGSSALWNNIHADIVTVYSTLKPDASASASIGGATARWIKTWTADLDVTGTITAPSGATLTGTVSCGGGQAVKTLTVSQGLVTAATCGTP